MIRKTIRWLLIFLALAGAAGGLGIWYAWTRGDEMLRVELEQRLQEIAPRCSIQIGRARFDWDRSIRVSDVMIGPKGSPPVLNVPEMIIRIDRQRFAAEHAVDVRAVRLLRPRFEMVRRLDGSWSVADLLPIRPPDPSIPIPEWQIEGATIRLRLEQPGNADPVVMTFQEATLHLVPAGRRQVLIRGLSGLADSGPLKIAGRVDLDRGIWSLEGSLQGVTTSGTIVGFALQSSKDLQTQVAKLGQKLEAAETALLAENSPNANRLPVKTVSRGNDPNSDSESMPSADDAPPVRTVQDLSDLGLNAVVDLRFRTGQPEVDGETEYQVWVDCRDGQVVNPLLPFALRHLRGGLYLDNSTLRLTDFKADGGGTAVAANGEFLLRGAVPEAGGLPGGVQLPNAIDLPGEVPQTPGNMAGTLAVAVTDLPISNRYPGRLPPAIERFLQIVRPSGPIDAAGTFHRDGSGRWIVQNFNLTAKGATAVPEAFPYPLHDITGTLVQSEPGRLRAHMVGRAGLRPVILDAAIHNPGLEAEVSVKIHAESIALDKTLTGALKPDQRKMVESLGLEGFADLDVELYRAPGFGQKYQWSIDANLRGGELEYEKFPYRLTQLSGRVYFDSESETWKLIDMTAVHDRAKIDAFGTFRMPTPAEMQAAAALQMPLDAATARLPEAPLKPDRLAGTAPSLPGLDLEFSATQIGLGDDMKGALPPEIRAVWEEIQPGGTANMNASVRWQPDTEPDIRISQFELTNGSAKMRAFPYFLDSIRATVSYVPGQVTIHELVGWHEGARLRVTRSKLVWRKSGEWLLHVPDVYADSLKLDHDFRRAAPEGLRTAIETLNPRGQITVAGAIEIRGSRDPSIPMTAGWDLEAQLSETSMSVGTDVEHMHGSIRCDGAFDGLEVDLKGQLALNRADMMGNRLENIRGPFGFTGERLWFGSSESLGNGPNAVNRPNVPMEKRISADYLGGKLLFDTVVTLAAPTRGRDLSYAGRVELIAGKLERYIPRFSNARNLAGVIHGFINFRGTGSDAGGLTGQGQMLIEPAALYELPVVMQMFNVLTSLSPTPPKNTAFTSARSDFSIRDRNIYFSFIELAGEQISFIGKGEAGFDEHLRLDFYSTPPRNPTSNIPLLGPLINGAGTGWIGIEVTGKVSAPVARQIPGKGLEDTVRQFLDSIAPVRNSRTVYGRNLRR